MSFEEEILDTLPFAISVQNSDRKVLFENKTMRQLLGDHVGKKCFTRWRYLDDRKHALDVCNDCPSKISLIDGKSHAVLRKTFTPDGQEIFLKIEHFPMFDEDNNVIKYVEFIRDVTEVEKDNLTKLTSFDKLTFSDFELVLTVFGDLGGEKIAGDTLSMFDKKEEQFALIKLSAFWLTAIGQGENFEPGFYGPLPVLDKFDYFSYAYAFRLKSKNADPRLEGLELVTLMFLVKRKNNLIFEDRKILGEYMDKFFAKYSDIDEIKGKNLRSLKKELISIIKSNSIQ